MFRLKNKKAVLSQFALIAKRIELALIRNLEIFVTKLEDHAKLSAGYKDQTGNLKSSIGGVVLKNGVPITYRGFEGKGADGVNTGLEYINSLISNYKKGYVILVVAGMDYAAYVEDYHDLNVLKKTELKMARELPKLLLNLKSTIG